MEVKAAHYHIEECCSFGGHEVVHFEVVVRNDPLDYFVEVKVVKEGLYSHASKEVHPYAAVNCELALVEEGELELCCLYSENRKEAE